MKKSILLLLCLVASLGTWAIDWSTYSWVTNGSGNSAYTEKYKVSVPSGVSVVNIQHPGFATADGFYITFPDAAFGKVCSNGTELSYDVDGAGIILHMSNFTAKETQVDVMNSGNTEARWTFYVYYADGTSGDDAGEVVTRTIHYYNSNSWTKPCAHHWITGGETTTWPGDAMTDEGNGWYSVVVPVTHTNIIFSDSGSSQTADLTIPSKDNDYYAYDEWVREIRGLGDWNNGKVWTSVNDKILTYTTTYNAYTQTSFKFHSQIGDTWYGNSGTITKASDFSTWWDMTADADIVLRTGAYAGTYSFQYNVETKRFNVVFPETENPTLTKNGHTVTLTPKYYGKGSYVLTISSTETLSGLGGAYWNVNGTGTDMRTSMTQKDANTLVCSVTSTSAPNIYTPLYVLMPGEIAFDCPNALDWIDNGPVATASSGTASLAIDGNTDTRWESAQTDDQWWMVDYKEAKKFNNIQIVWEGAYGKSFNILGSNNGTDWTNVTTVTDQTLSGFPYTQTIELASPVTYRYVKFEGVARGTGYGYSFWEFDTFYREADVLTTFSSKATNRFAVLGEADDLNVKTLNQYGETMNLTVEYSVSPADAGYVTDGKYYAEKTGDATITLTTGGQTTTAKVCGVVSENIALNKTVNAGYNADGATASNNGNEGDRWGSNGATHPDGDWWYVDLGAVYDISTLAIKWETACPNNYDIKVSNDGENWNVVKTYTEYPVNGNGTNDYNIYTDLGEVGGRYIGVWANTGYADLAYGISIFEFNAYGTASTGSTTTDITSVGYSTYFDSSNAYIMPTGVTGYIFSKSNNKIVETYNAGTVVPAGEALVLKGNADTYTLNYVTTSITKNSDNALLGTDEETALTADADYYFYGLSLDASSTEGSVGFYWMADNGAAFTNGAHKAYLKLAKTPAAKTGYAFNDDDASAINAVEISLDMNAPVYNLAGQRVAPSTKGILIQNGRKYINK